MPWGNLILSLLGASACYALLWSSQATLSASAVAFGALSVWQYSCECWRLTERTLVTGNPIVFQFGRFRWRESEACRHWFVTGETGTGKTFFFRRVIWQLCGNVPNWGGLVLDEKGVFVEILRGIFRNHPNKSEEDLVVIELRSDRCSEDWKPKVTFNFLDVPGIPYSNHAKTIVDVASALLKKGGDNPFFPQQATIHIEWGFKCLKAIDEPVTLKNCHDLLTSDSLLPKVMEILAALETDDAKLVRSHFQDNYLGLNEETFKGVQSTIAGYLSYFTGPEVAEVFCPEEPATFKFSDLDEGKVVSVSIPQKFSVERKYIYTLLKLSLYNHGLQRFDRLECERKDDNLLVGLFDEFQKTATASEAGISDYNTADTLREAKVMIMAGTQSTQSLVPPMGSRDKAQVFISNMANKVIFKAADEESAKSAADGIGKREVWRKSHGVSGGKKSFNKHREDRYVIQPYEFRKLRKFQCVLQHCEQGWQKVVLPPIGLDGKICEWWNKAKRSR